MEQSGANENPNLTPATTTSQEACPKIVLKLTDTQAIPKQYTRPRFLKHSFGRYVLRFPIDRNHPFFNLIDPMKEEFYDLGPEALFGIEQKLHEMYLSDDTIRPPDFVRNEVVIDNMDVLRFCVPETYHTAEFVERRGKKPIHFQKFCLRRVYVVKIPVGTYKKSPKSTDSGSGKRVRSDVPPQKKRKMSTE